MTDNMSVMHIINTQTCKDPVLMNLVRELVIATMSYNIHFYAKHIPGKSNTVADLLSRFQEEKAFATAPWLKPTSEVIPDRWLPW